MSDIGFPLKESYVQKSKHFYADGLARVVAWVEAHADKRLWWAAFEKFDKYKFTLKISSDFSSNDGKSANGCSRLLKLVDAGELTLGPSQILCIDSDYRFISSLCVGYSGPQFHMDHVYWTVVHSKENIQITDGVLDFVVSHIVGLPVDGLRQRSKQIVERFSSIVFTSLQGIYFLRAISWGQPHVECERFAKQFDQALIPLKAMRAVDFIDFEKTDQWLEFEALIKELESAVLEFFVADNLSLDFESFRNHLDSCGVGQNNAHLFVRGHDYSAVMIGVFKAICDGYRKERLAEIDSRKLPVKTIRQLKIELKSGWLDFDSTLQAQRIEINGFPFFDQTLQRLDLAYS